MMGRRLLMIEDDNEIASMVAEYLATADMVVTIASNGREGLALAKERWDGIILDLGLPDIDGFEVCRQLRNFSPVPILMLTARGDSDDRIVGLELGADDYLSKPFNPRELLARLRALLRRWDGTLTPQSESIVAGDLEIDPATRQARVDGAIISITGHQFDILLTLARNRGRVLSRERLMELVKGEELEAFDRSIDVHISRIRAQVEKDPRQPRRILTIRGTGYLFVDGEDSP